MNSSDMLATRLFTVLYIASGPTVEFFFILAETPVERTPVNIWQVFLIIKWTMKSLKELNQHAYVHRFIRFGVGLKEYVL